MTVTETQVRDVVVDITGLPPDSDPNANLYLELGVPSATALNLLLGLEERFGIQILDEDFVDANSINKLIAIVQGYSNKD